MMSEGSDFATNERVDRLVGDLRKDLLDTERLLRDRDDEKEKQLRAEFLTAVKDSEDRLHGRLDGVDAHLTRQDEYLMTKADIWPNVWRSMMALALASVAAAIILHFGFNIG